MARDSP